MVEKTEHLDAAIDAYQISPFSPDTITTYWRCKLNIDGKRAGLIFKVPLCNWNVDEIEEPMQDVQGNEIPGMMVYFPKALRGEKGYKRLTDMYPELHIQAFPATWYESTHESSGWIKAEAMTYSPNRNTSVFDLEEHAIKTGYLGQRLSMYLLASLGHKDISGEFFDDGRTDNIQHWTSSRLLGSNTPLGEVCIADFSDGGSLHTNPRCTPEDRYEGRGARFELIKKHTPEKL